MSIFRRLASWLLPPVPGLARRRAVERTITALLLTDFEDVDEGAVRGWTDAQLDQAWEWAAREHLHANDNDGVERLPMPPHVKAIHRPYRWGGA